MHVINFFGAPGAGKSSVSEAVSGFIKRRFGFETELCLEYAKGLVWEKQFNALRDQNFIFANQNRLLARLTEHKDLVFAVTDSPLLMSICYANPGYYPSFIPLVKEVFNSYNNINFYLSGTHEYSTLGRCHSREESQEVGATIEKLLKDDNIPYTHITSSTPTETIAFHILAEAGLLHTWPMGVPQLREVSGR